MALQVVTANRLLDGLVVYLGEGGWSERIDDGRVAEDKDAGEALLAEARRWVEDRVVVAPYLIDVAQEGGTLRATRYREAIRSRGPTVRTDLGKQAS